MTRLSPGSRTVTRVCQAVYRRRPIVIELRPYTMSLRLLGTRTWFELDYVAAYQLAARKQAERALAERRAAKRSRIRRRGG